MNPAQLLKFSDFHTPAVLDVGIPYEKRGGSMQTARDLFVHELQDMFDAEQRLVKALGEQEQESSRPELQKAFASHREQTENQVERLRQAFEDVGEEPEETECRGIKGLIEEHEAFKEEDPSEELLDIFNVGAAIKVESYEINAYESLVKLGRELGFKKAINLLNQNLKEEQQTLKKMEGFRNKLKPSELGVEEEGEDQPRRRSRRAA
jgi:ferritin-like metal-binding protein YciE